MRDSYPGERVYTQNNNYQRTVKTVTEEAGINTKMFKPHRTRAASTSLANQKAVPLENILEAAGWKSDCVIDKYYNKVVSKKSLLKVFLKHVNKAYVIGSYFYLLWFLPPACLALKSHVIPYSVTR